MKYLTLAVAVAVLGVAPAARGATVMSGNLSQQDALHAGGVSFSRITSSPGLPNTLLTVAPTSLVITPILSQSAATDGYSVVQTSAVPEPATWTMMLMGFGAIGATLRRRSALRPKAA